MATPQPTQARHPWRATTRTAVAVAVGALPLLPEFALDLHLPTAGVVGQTLTIAAGITRFLANPAVNTWLHSSPATSWLAANPAPQTEPLRQRWPEQPTKGD